MTRYVFDSFAILAYIRDEPGADHVGQLLGNRRNEHWMTTVNVGEVYYIARKLLGEDGDEILHDLLDTPIQFVDAGFSLAIEAAKLKSLHALSYADCFAAAAAQRYDAAVVTGDREFEKLETLVQIEWLPARLNRRS